MFEIQDAGEGQQQVGVCSVSCGRAVPDHERAAAARSCAINGGRVGRSWHELGVGDRAQGAAASSVASPNHIPNLCCLSVHQRTPKIRYRETVSCRHNSGKRWNYSLLRVGGRLVGRQSSRQRGWSSNDDTTAAFPLRQ